MIVLDASVAVKWYAIEPFTQEALGLLRELHGNITVPDIFISEVVGALVRHANIDKTLRSASTTSIDRFASLFDDNWILAERADPRRMERAASLALDLGHPLKDCIYLALAMELGCDLVTADARFAGKARGVWAGVRVLGGDA